MEKHLPLKDHNCEILQERKLLDHFTDACSLDIPLLDITTEYKYSQMALL